MAENVSPAKIAPRGGENGHEHTAAPYLWVYAALIFLTFLTWYTGQKHLGSWALPLALFIAVVKSTLVALFFMHLWEQKGPNRMVLIVSVLFVLLLLGLTLADVATRFELATPRGAPFGSRMDFTHGNTGESTSGSPAGIPAHDGAHPGFIAPSEGGLKKQERRSQDPTRP